MPALRCPRCRATLGQQIKPDLRIDRCSICHGVAIPMTLMRRFGPERRVNALWKKLGEGKKSGPCPSCDRAMIAAPVACVTCWLVVDTCRKCEFFWFEAAEIASFKPVEHTLAPPVPALSPRATEAFAGVDPKLLNAQPPEESRPIVELLEAIGPRAEGS